MKRTTYSRQRYPWLDSYELDTWESLPFEKEAITPKDYVLSSRAKWIFTLIALGAFLGFMYTLVWIFPHLYDLLSEALLMDYSTSITKSMVK